MSSNLTTKIVTTTPYNILNTDEVIFIDVTSGPASVILPSSGNATGEDCCGNKDKDNDDKKSNSNVLKRSFYIKDFSGTAATNTITITSAGGKTIDGNPFALINGGYAHIQVVYDGTDWKIIG
jgi:hypothetical protein